MSDLPRRRMDAVREELSDRCAEILLGYRRNCAVATQPSQLILPEAFKALPCYVLGLLKTKPLKGRTVSSDVRNFHRHRLLGMGCQDTMHHVYPRVLALHDLDDRIALPDPEHGGRIMYPTHMRASYAWMEGHGIYLIGLFASPDTSPAYLHVLVIDNEEMAVFWVGLSVNPSQIRDLFGVEDVGELDPRLVRTIVSTPSPRFVYQC
jgi:protein transport protein SEC24